MLEWITVIVQKKLVSNSNSYWLSNAYVPGRSEVDVVGNKKCLDDLRLPDYLHGTQLISNTNIDNRDLITL